MPWASSAAFFLLYFSFFINETLPYYRGRTIFLIKVAIIIL